MCFVFNYWRFNLIGIGLLYVSFLLDQVDGEIARYYQRPSFNLLYLDEIRHLVIYPLPLFCLAFGAFSDTHSSIVFLLSFFCALALILARINERIALLIYMDRAILRSNFKEIDLREYLNSRNGKKSVQSPTSRAKVQSRSRLLKISKTITASVYRAAHFYCDQVTILVCLLCVTIMDLYLPSMWGLMYQTWFLLSFSIIVPATFIRTVCSWYQEKMVEKQCVDLEQATRAHFVKNIR